MSSSELLYQYKPKGRRCQRRATKRWKEHF